MSQISFPTFASAVFLSTFFNLAHLPISTPIGSQTTAVQAQTQSSRLQAMTIERLERILRDEVRNTRNLFFVPVLLFFALTNSLTYYAMWVQDFTYFKWGTNAAVMSKKH